MGRGGSRARPTEEHRRRGQSCGETTDTRDQAPASTLVAHDGASSYCPDPCGLHGRAGRGAAGASLGESARFRFDEMGDLAGNRLGIQADARQQAFPTAVIDEPI